MDTKANFFSKAATASAPSMLQIAFVNDPKFRAGFGQWLADNFDALVLEYKNHGRFLTLAEIQDTDSPLDF